MPLADLPPRIVEKIVLQPRTGCWLWTAYVQPLHREQGRSGGYGTLSWQGTTRYAHRVVYELLVGVIPVGMEVDHLCRTRHCVNPKHLEPVTRKVNARRGRNGWNLKRRAT